jgi:hypothetical protein
VPLCFSSTVKFRSCTSLGDATGAGTNNSLSLIDRHKKADI